MATFEENLAELETIVARLELGKLPLEENVALFERGVALTKACRTVLADAEHRIQVVSEPEEEDGGLEALEVGEDEDEDDEIEEEED
jgi:exodeoxyribonuclease VII small subunit